MAVSPPNPILRWKFPAPAFCAFLIATTSVVLGAGNNGVRQQTDLTELRLQAKAEIEKEMGGLPSLGEHEPGETLRFTLNNGKVYPVTDLPAGGAGFRSIKLKGMPGWAKVAVLGDETIHSAAGRKFIQFLYRDVSVPGCIEMYTEVYANPDSVNISQEASLPDDGIWSVQFIQAAAPGAQAVSLYIQKTTADGPQRQQHLIGATLADLCEKYPGQTSQYVRPIFRMFHQESAVFHPDSKTAYEVLGDLWQTDRGTAVAVDAAIAGLGADSYAARERALAQLRELGQPAALYLMRAAPVHLSAEQAMRVDSFLSAYRPVSADQASRLKSDRDFLLDCLYSPDADIRRMGLEQLRRVTGKPIEADVNSSGAALEAAVARLRQSLAPSTLPAAP